MLGSGLLEGSTQEGPGLPVEATRSAHDHPVIELPVGRVETAVAAVLDSADMAHGDSDPLQASYAAGDPAAVVVIGPYDQLRCRRRWRSDPRVSLQPDESAATTREEH